MGEGSRLPYKGVVTPLVKELPTAKARYSFRISPPSLLEIIYIYMYKEIATPYTSKG